MFLKFRIIGVVLLSLSIGLILLDAGGVVEAGWAKGPAYLPLIGLALFFLFEEQPPLTLLSLLNSATQGKVPTNAYVERYREAVRARAAELPRRPRQDYLHRNRLFVLSVCFLILFGIPLAEGYIFSRKLGRAFERSQLLDVVEEVTFQTPSAADEILLDRSSEVAAQSASGVVGWVGTQLTLHVPWISLSPRSFRASLQIVREIKAEKTSSAYSTAPADGRYRLLLACYESAIEKRRKLIEDLLRAAPPSMADEQDRKVFLILIGRMALGVSNEGSRPEYATLAERCFVEAETLPPTLSSCFNGLGIVASWKLGRDSTVSEEAEDYKASEIAYQEALQAARSPYAAARVKNNLADLRLRVLLPRIIPAWAAGTKRPSFVMKSSISRGRASYERVLREPMAALGQAYRLISEGLSMNGADGINFATRGQILSIAALAVERGSGKLSSDEVRWLDETTEKSWTGRARRDAVECLLTMAFDDFQEATRNRAPLGHYFGDRTKREHVGMYVWDLRGHEDWLDRLIRLWALPRGAR